MQRKRITEELPENCFREGKYVIAFTDGGMLCSASGEEEERLLPYEDVRFYRTVQRKSVSDIGRAKLYFTAPFPFSRSYNRYCFMENGKRYLTHEFTDAEKRRAEECLARFSVPVIDRRVRLGGIAKLRKSFCEEKFTRSLFATGITLFAALLIGVVIMYLLNYFLHTETESLAMVFGIFCVPCLAVILFKAQELGSHVKVYDRGVYLLIRIKSGDGNTSPYAKYRAFFAWEEVESIERVQSQVQYFVKFRLGYCVYTVPDFDGLYEYLEQNFPEKCKTEAE